MPLQFSTTLRDGRANQIESVIGSAPTLEIRSGTKPLYCSSATTGTLIASITLPSDWLTAADNGNVQMIGVWQDLSADNAGVCGYFRIFQSGTCHIQGTVGESDADMIVDNATVESGQTFTILSFTITEGNV